MGATPEHLIAGTTGDKSERFVVELGKLYRDKLHCHRDGLGSCWPSKSSGLVFGPRWTAGRAGAVKQTAPRRRRERRRAARRPRRGWRRQLWLLAASCRHGLPKCSRSRGRRGPALPKSAEHLQEPPLRSPSRRRSMLPMLDHSLVASREAALPIYPRSRVVLLVDQGQRGTTFAVRLPRHVEVEKARENRGPTPKK